MLEILSTNGIIQFVTTLAALAIVVMLWKNRSLAEVRYLILIEINVAVWAFTYACEFSTPVLENKIFWSQLSYFGIAFLPVSYFFFTQAFNQKFRFLSTKNYLLLSILPILTVLLVLTNSLHHWVWKDISLPENSDIMFYEHGPWFWIFYGYAFLLIGLGLLNLVRSYFHFSRYYRSQISLLLIASIIPVLGNIAYITNLNPIPGFDWTTACFVVTGLVIAIGVYRHRMFEVIPLATQKLIEVLQDGVIVVNNQGEIEEMNPTSKQIFNFGSENMNRADFKEIFKNYSDLMTAIEHDKENNFEMRLKNKEGIRYYMVKISPIFNRSKQKSGKLIIITDITSIRKSELQLKNRNHQLLKEIERNEKLIEDLDSFAHTVAHDLKNLLGGIYSTSEILVDLQEDGNYEMIREISNLIKDSAFKTIQITEELMKLATAGYDDVEKEPVDMQQIFDQAKGQVANLISEHDAKIEVTTEWQPVMAYGPWLIEVWMNYISNAIKYGGNPPIITAGSTKVGKNKVKFWVRDNGDGITPEDQTLLFNKHTRLAPDKSFGYGLGLSIAKRIIEKMDGSVGVESSGKKGEGAEFFFILPSK